MVESPLTRVLLRLGAAFTLAERKKRVAARAGRGGPESGMGNLSEAW